MSVLSCFYIFNLIEQAVLSQLIDQVNLNGLGHKNQSVYKFGISTETVLLSIKTRPFSLSQASAVGLPDQSVSLHL